MIVISGVDVIISLWRGSVLRAIYLHLWRPL